MANLIQKVTTFYDETLQEVKKCTWPTRQELVHQTNLVILTVVGLVVFIFLVDQVVTWLVQMILSLGS